MEGMMTRLAPLEGVNIVISLGLLNVVMVITDVR